MTQAGRPARRPVAEARQTRSADVRQTRSARGSSGRGKGGRSGNGADEAKEAGREVGKQAQQEARATAETARSEAAAVADTAQQEAAGVAQTGLQALQDQAKHQTDQLAERLYDVRDELDYLLQGQPEHAGQVGEVAQQLADRMTDAADRVAAGGPQGLVDDARDLAGRRPGLFLLGAAAAGFGVGRLLRGTRDADDQLVEQERAAAQDASSRSGQDKR